MIISNILRVLIIKEKQDWIIIKPIRIRNPIVGLYHLLHCVIFCIRHSVQLLICCIWDFPTGLQKHYHTNTIFNLPAVDSFTITVSLGVTDCHKMFSECSSVWEKNLMIYKIFLSQRSLKGKEIMCLTNRNTKM